MDKLRSVELYRDELRKIMVIESVELSHSKFNNGGQVYGSLAPIAIIVCTSDGNEVLTVTTDHTQPDKLQELLTKMHELIAQACA